ncbi:ABC transporter ATP-binding protein [Albimonas sp. CAU 1670]|uniref:ABC transporter ATP-binding protein n=1 Tax=Albimonas sp. CAU 1670 TaxID=3032599 RepID=UPI0023DBCD77|nr:ABC transporter ATP-binding protein [Albimonas sp. CAU 1670]MDF2234766.1 ABC transporter ATP-binding protein [Albimonas sp. CAU 1670]
MTRILPPNPPVLSVKDLRVAFGRHEAVRGLSFDLHAGETLALVGESGSGKSTAALSILRLVEREGGRIAGGSIRLGDTEVTTLPPAALRAIRGDRVAMVFQEPMTSLNPVMRVGEQLEEAVRLHRGLRGRAARAACLAALERVRIPEPARRLRQHPHELSGGLRQRVMIAMALACEPDVLIADEPTTALDVTTQAEILDLMRSLQAELGMAVLFITHDMGVVAEMADRVVVMRHGEKVEEATTEGLFSAPRSDYARELLAAIPRLGAGSPAPLASPEPLLEVRNLTTRFGRGGIFRKAPPPVVRDVSLTLARGETLGLVGESGCGKSTLARSILRLVEPEAGHATLDGLPLTGVPQSALKAARRRMQMVFQDPYASLNPRLPIADLVTEPAFLAGLVSPKDRRALAEDLLERVRLEPEAAERFPHQFSGGQRQRICIARALSVRPALIVADEAVSALDVSIARRVTDLMAEIQARDGVSFLFISHDLAVVERVSHRIAVMLRGEIVEMGPTAQVLSDPRHSYTRKLLAAAPRPDPARRAEQRAAPVPADPGGWRWETAGPAHFVRAEAG